MYLELADFTQKSVVSSSMLQPGGGVAMGKYTRRAKNVVSSPGLLSRMKWTASNMRANCSLGDKCVPLGMTDMAIGQPVPGSPSKRYVACDAGERGRRLDAARTCAISTLSTKSAVYSRAG